MLLTGRENQTIVVFLADGRRVDVTAGGHRVGDDIVARQYLEQRLHVHLRQSIDARQPRRRSGAGAHAQARAFRLRHRRLVILADVQMRHTGRLRFADKHFVERQIRQHLFHFRIEARPFVRRQRQRRQFDVAGRRLATGLVLIDGGRQVAVLAEQRDLDAGSS